MADFLFIIPAGWTRLPEDTLERIAEGPSTLISYIENGSTSTVNELLHSNGIIPETTSVIEAKVFNGDIVVIRTEG